MNRNTSFIKPIVFASSALFPIQSFADETALMTFFNTHCGESYVTFSDFESDTMIYCSGSSFTSNDVPVLPANMGNKMVIFQNPIMSHVDFMVDVEEVAALGLFGDSIQDFSGINFNNLSGQISLLTNVPANTQVNLNVNGLTTTGIGITNLGPGAIYLDGADGITLQGNPVVSFSYGITYGAGSSGSFLAQKNSFQQLTIAPAPGFDVSNYDHIQSVSGDFLIEDSQDLDHITSLVSAGNLILRTPSLLTDVSGLANFAAGNIRAQGILNAVVKAPAASPLCTGIDTGNVRLYNIPDKSYLCQ